MKTRIVNFVLGSLIFLGVTSARPKTPQSPEPIIAPGEIERDTIDLNIKSMLNEVSKSNQEKELTRIEVEKSLKKYAEWRSKK